MRPEEAVQATLSSLPDEVVDTVQVTTLPSEDSVSERKRKLEFLEMQEELIKVDFSCIIYFIIWNINVSGGRNGVGDFSPYNFKVALLKALLHFTVTV